MGLGARLFLPVGCGCHAADLCVSGESLCCASVQVPGELVQQNDLRNAACERVFPVFQPCVSRAMGVVMQGWPAEGLVGVSGAFNFRTDLQLGLSEPGSRTWRGWPHQSHHSRPTTTCAGQWLLLPCTQTRSPKLPVPLLVLLRCA